ncbi:MAG TPA: bifunctional phosphoribosyl-AMP cyclohydrolase/phosphoribosyl-ATP diphosphatase HisIE [Chitinophagaceae bacterium]|nr:bifunctional phosphoribosyl-AMP cyclohydrolase/phosphoribosyl-ATP diphosphatase HisIE [Chitinophagaceae bacterium]
MTEQDDILLSITDFAKSPDGLVPAIVQDAASGIVLMLGYMNRESLEKTLELKKLTFFSRSRKKLWTKGEESGHFLILETIRLDCDQDTLLVKARPQGPVCHTGADTCFSEENKGGDFLTTLEQIIQDRKTNLSADSYTSRLLAKGINKIAQKLGEEAVELVIESKDEDKTLFLNEAADLLYHYLVLLAAKGYQLSEVKQVLEDRHRIRNAPH